MREGFCTPGGTRELSHEADQKSSLLDILIFWTEIGGLTALADYGPSLLNSIQELLQCSCAL